MARQLNKALLKAEQMKASAGLMAILSNRAEGGATAAGAAAAAGAGGEASSGRSASVSPLPWSSAGHPSAGMPAGMMGFNGRPLPGGDGNNNNGPARPTAREMMEVLPAAKLTPRGLEYAKQRGIYRGDEMSW